MKEVLNKLKEELKNSFGDLNKWFDVEHTLLRYRPMNRGWTIQEILEHVSLTNHFLLILIRKGTEKAVQKAKEINLSEAISDYTIDWKALSRIGEHGSFQWVRPEHMEPTGELSLPEIKNRLVNQLAQCITHLNQMPNGEGVLYKTTMTVDNLGKIDVYHYLYFLAQHIRRHVEQIHKTAAEFERRRQPNEQK